MEAKRLYPLTFAPLLKEIIWGGTDIRPFKGLAPSDAKVGESWEISHVDGNYSVVAEGELAGKDLDELMKTFGPRLVGKRVLERSGERFPLLIKFIDAQDNLSIQVHPDDKLAMRRHNSFGKTEMWYVVKASPEAHLYSGFARQSSPEDYERRLEEGTFMETLQRYDVQAGDVFFLPAGRVHAIGAGCFVAEIQQTSNITYRIYDYDRTDKDGNKRELHIEEAKDAIDFSVQANYRTPYTPEQDAPVHLVTSPYFETHLLDITKDMPRSLERIDSFAVYMVLEGALTLTDDAGYTVELRQGQSVLIPAEAKGIELKPKGHAKLLETYVP